MTQTPAQTLPRDLRSWDDFHQDPDFYVSAKKLLKPDTKIFTMGSCFAFEIRRTLRDAGFHVTPNYLNTQYDPKTQIFDKVVFRNAAFHYDTFVMREEFEEVFGVRANRDINFHAVRDSDANRVLESEEVWQDPTRRHVYAKTLPLLKELSAKIARVTRNGLAQSDVVVLTLGLTEAWPHVSTGWHFCLPPGTGLGGGDNMATHKLTTFNENYQNTRAIIELILAHYPKKHIIISVSPVHLERTYAQTDVGSASTESKSILRAVAGQVTREYGPNVIYYPAYEMAQFRRDRVFGKDGRHVMPEFVNYVVGGFVGAFSADLPRGAKNPET